MLNILESNDFFFFSDLVFSPEIQPFLYREAKIKQLK